MTADGNAAIYRSDVECVNQGDLGGYLDHKLAARMLISGRHEAPFIATPGA